MPALFGGFGNYFVVIFQGSPEVVYPRVNNFSILILFLSYLFLILSLISEFGGGTGWTLYPPLSTSFMSLSPSSTGNLLFRQFIYYILIIPAFGIVSIIISGILQKIIFGNQSMIFAMSCISLLGSVVWGHHMYTVGLETDVVTILFGILVFFSELQLYYKLSLESSWLYIIHQILTQHILVFSFLLEKSSMDGVYVIFILVEHHLSFFFYFYILEELCFMVHTFIIQILGFQELLFSSS